MSYNTDLQNNNILLNEILTMINNLPEGGNGSNIEVCTVKIINNYLGSINYRIAYTNDSIIATSDNAGYMSYGEFIELKVLSNSVFYFNLLDAYDMSIFLTGNYQEIISGDSVTKVFAPIGDVTITFEAGGGGGAGN